ncbi:MAG: hypothetical protein PHO86_03185 [Bacilli bacterium]|nr:hypothetical protein [Bacilli bacterium]
MNLIFYRERIKRFEREYQKPYQKRNKLLGFLIVLNFFLAILSALLIVLEIVNLILVIVFFVSLFTLLIIQYVKIYKANQKCKNEFIKLIVDIINGEENVEIEYIKDDNKYRSLIKSTRIVYSSDTLYIKAVLKFKREENEGTAILVVANRSQGNTTVTVLNGIVYIYDKASVYNLQVRNDYYRGPKAQKNKSLSTKFMSVYTFLGEADSNYDGIIEKSFTKIIEGSNVKHAAVDYQKNQIAIYVDKREAIKIPKQMSDESIKDVCRVLLDIVDVGCRISSIIIPQEY